MIKLRDMAYALEKQEAKQRVILEDYRTGRQCYEGTAEDLADYSGIDYKKVVGVKVLKDGTLKLYIRNPLY